MVTAHGRSRRGTKLAEQLAHEIVVDIARSGLRAGDRLTSEVTMAQERGVSRTSLREALRILEVHGLIRVRSGPNGGPVLIELTSSDFARMATLHFQVAGVTYRQLLEARVVLEPRMAQLAAIRRTPEQLRALQANLGRHEQATTVAALVDCAHEFHALISVVGGNSNKALSLMTSSLHGFFDVYSHRSGDVALMRETVDVHRGIADAIAAEDAHLATELMEKHMRTSIETFAQECPSLIDNPVTWSSE
ncbi:MAG: FadR family transcriptional regulator [Rhodococcus sp. (in: high G+C Gram-positive bacteria)]|nr:MAG: FadR family transcriptional regulator [Rhodococcus sp. (in: high G+C Gram-positive bacteria)]